ncbi:YqcC family protein [Photobacterium sp. WH77]|uniref:YqcC family protein n=2 Tax=Photobacterium TaxID=657 RepID=A0A7X4WD11_9GAMM|nr:MULTISPECIES: YqcC family protein [Photobacterium]MBD8514980.1 YqcC family protein [Photobacterium arenosum]MBV7263734.1 YqcC family protein [Photobacterium sp. WH24]MCG2838815.1 YqcC family protein [Photobacterium sp. WH77]MCG2846432.1 YqcC family protein [Photobacterium sp. WH80]NAW65610.1 YqcC family protein [Photobacterium halotolerans]
MDCYEKTTRLLVRLEQQLRAQGLWQHSPPSEEALASTEPFAIDTLTCAEWLQWIFLPRMYHLVEERLMLPTQFNIYPYAEESAKLEPELAGVLPLIAELDHWLGGANQ